MICSASQIRLAAVALVLLALERPGAGATLRRAILTLTGRPSLGAGISRRGRLPDPATPQDLPPWRPLRAMRQAVQQHKRHIGQLAYWDT